MAVISNVTNLIIKGNLTQLRIEVSTGVDKIYVGLGERMMDFSPEVWEQVVELVEVTRMEAKALAEKIKDS